MYNKKTNPTCILSSDWHIRGDTPICRTDDYMGAQRQKIEFICKLSRDSGAHILVAGDFGHRPMWGDRLLNWFIPLLQDHYFDVTLGQHDLPNHRLDKWGEGGLGILNRLGTTFQVRDNGFDRGYLGNDKYYEVNHFPYSVQIRSNTKYPQFRKIALVHQMVIKSQDDKLWHDQSAVDGKRLLKKFPCYNLIVSGDNHQSFVVEHEGRLLVNAGSMMRMTAGQVEHKPSVYLWYAESNTVERIYLPIEDNVISRDHIDVVKERDERVESFVNRLKNSHEVGFDFEGNMKEFLNKNKVGRLVEEKIWGHINESSE